MTVYQDHLFTEAEHLLTPQLNRPQARNALRDQTLAELAAVLAATAYDNQIRCAVVYGNLNVFAAGADLDEMAQGDMITLLDDPRPGYWARVAALPKPIVAAVNGFALGAGCALARLADIAIAGRNVGFDQPEINLGIMPGAMVCST